MVTSALTTPAQDAMLRKRIDRAVVRQEMKRLKLADRSLRAIALPDLGAIDTVILTMQTTRDDRARINAARYLLDIAEWGIRRGTEAPTAGQTNIQINFPLPHPAHAVEPDGFVDLGTVEVSKVNGNGNNGNGQH